MKPDADDPFTLTATVPVDVMSQGSFEYTAELTEQHSGLRMTYPEGGGTQTATQVGGDAQEFTLSDATYSGLEPGTLVALGPWGDGPDAWGFTPDGAGPASFDVDEHGNITVLDQVNSRLATITTDGSRSNASVGMRSGVPDIALDGDTRVAITYQTGGAGEGFMDVLSRSTGRKLQQIPLSFSNPGRVRSDHAGGLWVMKDAANWRPARDRGRTLSRAAQGRAGGAGVPHPINGVRVVAQHVDNHTVRISAQRHGRPVAQWILRSRSWLGPIQLAEPLIGSGRAAVVLTQFDNDRAQYRLLHLAPGRVLSDQSIPAGEYVQTTAGSTFRLGGDGGIYEARSTPGHFAIYRYTLKSEAHR